MAETTLHRKPWAGVLRRWPTGLAVAVAVLMLTGDESDEAIAEILPLLSLEYLIIAKLGRRQATWPVIAVLFAATSVMMALEIPPSGVFATLAMLVLVWGTVDRQLFRDGELQIQALGMVGFGALAAVGLALDSDLGRYIVAAGWLLHGVWDFVHLWRDKVVPRSYAEWCGVLDILIAAGLVFLL